MKIFHFVVDNTQLLAILCPVNAAHPSKAGLDYRNMQIATKHTPRPWQITCVNHNGWTLDGWVKPFMPLYRIGDRDEEITAAEAMANAQLMESAPLLLAMCENALEALGRLSDDNACMSEFERACIPALKAAIAKATNGVKS